MSRDIWVSSDFHLSHANILKFTDSNTGELIRGAKFSSVKEMNEYMLDKHNSMVKPGDIFYTLGDVMFGSRDEFQKIWPKFNGQKRLIVGNHDDIKYLSSGGFFSKVLMWRMFPEFGLLFTHVPVHPSNLHRGAPNDPDAPVLFNVIGHIHQNPAPRGPYRCVCVEQTDYTPVHIETLAAEAKHYKENQLEKDLPLFQH